MKIMKYILPAFLFSGIFAISYSQQNANILPEYQITLSNSIYYLDTAFTDLPGNGFLIDTGNEILAITCKHVLWTNRTAEMKTIDLDGKLIEWRMEVINDPTQYILLGDLINVNKNETIGERNTDEDFLVFKIKENHSKVVPLKLSSKLVQPHDTLYQVGWSYKTKKSLAQQFAAIANKYCGSGIFVQSLIQQNNAGLSGSPVINKRKELVAIVSNWRFDIETQNWFEAPCSIDYLWGVLYSNWLGNKKKEKSTDSFQEFLANYESINGSKPEVSSYLYTELFFSDWLKFNGLIYGSIEHFKLWAESLHKAHGITITADNYRKSLLVFDSWKESYSTEVRDISYLEQELKKENLTIPNFIDFCEFALELSAIGKHDKAIELLLYADEKIQHMGQLYAYLGDIYYEKGEIQLAIEAYLKCLQTYPEYPKAVDGIKKNKL